MSATGHQADRAAPVEPMSLKEALEGPYQPEWESSMGEEIACLTKTLIWELVPRPPGVRVLGSSWKFRIKQDSASGICKFKSRLVAQGFAQQQGINYSETYSPVIKRKSIRLMLALSVELNLCGEHVNVVSAYVNSPIQEDVYMEQPKHFVIGDRGVMVCELNKCLCGLKQSGREWYRMIKTIRYNMGFRATIGDPCLFYHSLRKLFVGLYVDDLGVWGLQESVNWFKSNIVCRWKPKN